jgi:Lipase (class 3)
LDGLPTDSPQLVLTGHSLGGALAVLAAFSLAEQFTVRQVITFGQPRVGLFRFRDSYNTKACGPGQNETLHAITRRYIHATDVVSRVPPPMPYCHVGSRWLLDGSGKCTQGRSKKLLERLEEAYYDLKLKWLLWPAKVKAKQERRLVSWDGALKSRVGQTPAAAEKAWPIPGIEGMTNNTAVVGLGTDRFEAFLSALGRFLMTAGYSPFYALSLIAGILTAVVVRSYWRDAESHFIDGYVKAFGKEHPTYAPQSALTYIEVCKKKYRPIPPPWKTGALASK